MSSLVNTPKFIFNIQGIEQTELKVLSFDGAEGLSRLFEINVELVSRKPPAQPPLLGGCSQRQQ
ncbi:MAG: hypothetical protein ACOH2O_16420, partial [Pseudomonas sp.]